MQRNYRYHFLVLLCATTVLFSCKKVEQQLDSINNQPGIYDMFPRNAFIGDTVEITGKFNNDPNLRFFFGDRAASIVSKGTKQVPKGGYIYGQAALEMITVEAYKVIVPDSISGSSLVTALFGGLSFPVATFGLRKPPPLIPGNVLVSTYAGIDPYVNTPGIHDDSLLKANFGFIETMIVQPDGTIYTADFEPNSYMYYVRKVADGKVTTIAGGGTQMEGPGLDINFGEIKGMAVDAQGDIYIAERTYDPVYYSPFSRILKMNKNTHEVSVFAGRMLEGVNLPYDSSYLNDGPRLQSTFYDIGDLSFDAAGNLYVADYGNNTIRVITADGMVSSPVAARNCYDAGGFPWCDVLSGYEDGFGKEVRLTGPAQIAAALNNRVYFTEFSTLRELNPPSAEVTTIGGFPDQTLATYGPLNTAKFYQLRSVAPDAEGNLLVVDGNTILKIDLTERYVYILAGTGTQGYKDGKGEDAVFNFPTEVGFDAKGNFYVADRGNRLIRKITVQ